MSEHEALARFHYGCAARHHKVEIRRRWRSPLHDARTTITFDERPNQDPALAELARLGAVLHAGRLEDIDASVLRQLTARLAADEVQRSPFSSEDGAGRAGDRQQVLSARHACCVSDMRPHVDIGR